MLRLIIFFLLLSFLGPGRAFAAVSIEYGHVTAVEVTTKESAMARNMLIGSVVGLALKDSFSGAWGGAMAGFAVTSVMENDRRLFAYTVSLDDGRYETVVMSRPDIALGHCAALERDGDHVNLRPVSAVHCAADAGAGETPAGEHRESAAEKCSDARDTLANAEAGADISAALRAMRAYCE
jgi:hypothetical protein